MYISFISRYVGHEHNKSDILQNQLRVARQKKLIHTRKSAAGPSNRARNSRQKRGTDGGLNRVDRPARGRVFAVNFGILEPSYSMIRTSLTFAHHSTRLPGSAALICHPARCLDWRHCREIHENSLGQNPENVGGRRRLGCRGARPRSGSAARRGAARRARRGGARRPRACAPRPPRSSLLRRPF